MSLQTFNHDRYLDRTFESLGTMNYIKIFDLSNQGALDQAMKRVLQIDEMMSAFKNGSDIFKLNHRAGSEFVKLNPETFKILKKSRQFSEMCAGAFDITIKPLVDLWGIGQKKNYIPAQADIEKAKNLVHYQDILMDPDSCRAALKRNGQSIDLGGIAKGYAADEVKRILTEHGIQNALINLGGNIVVMGTPPHQISWKIGIQNPLESTGIYLGTISLRNKTIVTSGTNERFFIKNRIRYHHILDPSTGGPAASSLLSVSIICDCSTDADALAKILFIKGPQIGLDILKKFHADAILITENLDVFTTEGLKNHFTLIQEEKK